MNFENCFKCGISGERAKLLETISNGEIVMACRRCSFNEGTPVIKKPLLGNAGIEEKKQSVYERLSGMAGIKDPQEHRKKTSAGGGLTMGSARENSSKENVNLREIIERNYKEKVNKSRSNPKDLVDNFHWIIMRARRKKKITQEELAKAIKEPLLAIQMAEKGDLPERYEMMMRKIETYLDINLFNEKRSRNTGRDLGDDKKQIIDFSHFSSGQMTISDLKRIKSGSNRDDTEYPITKEKNENRSTSEFDRLSELRDENGNSNDSLNNSEDDSVDGKKPRKSLRELIFGKPREEQT